MTTTRLPPLLVALALLAPGVLAQEPLEELPLVVTFDRERLVLEASDLATTHVNVTFTNPNREAMVLWYTVAEPSEPNASRRLRAEPAGFPLRTLGMGESITFFLAVRAGQAAVGDHALRVDALSQEVGRAWGFAELPVRVLPPGEGAREPGADATGVHDVHLDLFVDAIALEGNQGRFRLLALNRGDHATLLLELEDPEDLFVDDPALSPARVGLMPGAFAYVDVPVQGSGRGGTGSGMALRARLEEAPEQERTFPVRIYVPGDLPYHPPPPPDPTLGEGVAVRPLAGPLRVAPGTVASSDVVVENGGNRTYGVFASPPKVYPEGVAERDPAAQAPGWVAQALTPSVEMGPEATASFRYVVRAPAFAAPGERAVGAGLVRVTSGMRSVEVPYEVEILVVRPGELAAPGVTEAPPDPASSGEGRDSGSPPADGPGDGAAGQHGPAGQDDTGQDAAGQDAAGQDAAGASVPAPPGPFRLPSLGVREALALAGAAALALAALLLARREAWRWAALTALAPLYTRIPRDRTLDHRARQALLRLVEATPGIHYRELKRRAGLNTGALVHHLRALEAQGYVTSRREGTLRRFFALGAAPVPPAPDVPTTPMQARVLALLDEGPLTQRELAQRLSLSQQGLNHHVKTLERKGLLVSQPGEDGVHRWRRARRSAPER